MKVVFCCVPQTGHILPLLPLARGFVDRGDEVVMASGPDAAPSVSGLGLSFRAVGPAFDAWFGVLRARTRGIPGDGLAPSRIESYFVPRLFGEIGMALVIDDLLALCQEVDPTLVVFDPYLLAAPLAAAVIGAHPVLHCIGPLWDQGVLDLARDAVSPVWRELGIDVPPTAGLYAGTTLTICPPSLEPGAVGLVGARPLRPAPLPHTDPPPLPVSFAHPENPLVYVTLGTFSNTALELFALVIGALAEEPVNVLATIGRDGDPSALAPLPDNARVERYVPQTEVLPHSAAVVHHAGAGTMFGVLAHGLPSLVLPQSADNFVNAELLSTVGVAHTLMPGQVTAPAVVSGLRSVLDSASYRQRARQLAQEIEAMPSPDEVAAMLAGPLRA